MLQTQVVEVLGEGMMLENIQKVIDSLEAQKEKPFAVIMSKKNFEVLLNTIKQDRLIVQGIPNKAPPSIGKEGLILFGVRIKGNKYFPEDSILCVTKDGYDKIKGEAISNLLNMKNETWEERAERIKRFLRKY